MFFQHERYGRRSCLRACGLGKLLETTHALGDRAGDVFYLVTGPGADQRTVSLPPYASMGNQFTTVGSACNIYASCHLSSYAGVRRDGPLRWL